MTRVGSTVFCSQFTILFSVKVIICLYLLLNVFRMPAYDKNCYYCILFSVYYFILSLSHYLSVSPAEYFQDAVV